MSGSAPVVRRIVNRVVWGSLWPGFSGAMVARLFSRVYALLLVVAWISLAVQIRLLIGREGLLPLRPLLESASAQGGFRLLDYPSILRWPALAGDGFLLAGALVGAGLGATALAGLRPRLCFALSTILYLSYATACRGFLSFQWDNLLLECGLLATFLPGHRTAPAVHFLFRVLLFKLYFESGLAKWQSGLGDWRDGSAMTFYYETAPLPTWLGFYAHNLPAWWHHIESRAALFLELVVPLAIFGPRWARLLAASAFTLFQLVNAATANYGFFCYLALALHLFLLDDRDLEWARGKVLARLPTRLADRLRGSTVPDREENPGRFDWRRWPSPVRASLAVVGIVSFLGISLVEALDRFGLRGEWTTTFLRLERLYSPFRLINTYHLFASVTRERIEPQIEVRSGGIWQEHDLRYKPGDPGRAPPFVAPHQPRVDFLLWFHGLNWQRAPAYLAALVEQICQRPEAVRGLFAGSLPDRPESVRVAYHRYRFVTVAERRRAGLYWRRSPEGQTAEVTCDR